MFVEFPWDTLPRWGLGQTPARHVTVRRRFDCMLWGVSTWADRRRSSCLVLEAPVTTSVAKRVFGVDFELGFVVGSILRARVLLKVI